MSTVPPSSTSASSGGVPLPPGVTVAPGDRYVKLISHSMIFYWWPVWFLAFVMAGVTAVENHRLAIVPEMGTVTRDPTDGSFTMRFPEGKSTHSLDEAVRKAGSSEPAFPARVSGHAAPGAIFVVGLVLTIVITNVPLRGLWSFLVLIMILVVAMFITLLEGWDRVFRVLGNLHIHINMAGYLFIGVAVFVIWAVATFVFDRRSYIIFTPGQIRYCENIWDSVKVYPSAGAVLEKQRDDLFRHYIFGFFSGDLLVRVGHGSDRHEIKLPNILGLGFRLGKVEDMLRRVETVRE